MARVMRVQTDDDPLNALSALLFFLLLALKPWQLSERRTLFFSRFLSCPSRPQTLEDPRRWRLLLSLRTLAPIMARSSHLKPSTVRSSPAPMPQRSDRYRSPHRSLSLLKIPVWVTTLSLSLSRGIRVFYLSELVDSSASIWLAWFLGRNSRFVLVWDRAVFNAIWFSWKWST